MTYDMTNRRRACYRKKTFVSTMVLLFDLDCNLSLPKTLFVCFHLTLLLPLGVALSSSSNPIKNFIDSANNNNDKNMALQNSPSSCIRLVTNKMCPFAQKAWIALECSQTPYELQEISLYGSGGKPDWFLQLNPKGTVPVLVCNGDGGALVLPDSDLILDALEQGHSAIPPCHRALFPSDTERRQAVRAWRQRVNDMLPIGKQAVLSGNSNALQQVLQSMDNLVQGPYLIGEELTTADCQAFPFLWRLEQEFGLTSLSAPALSRWVQHCSQNVPGVQKTIQSSWWWWW